MSVLSLCRRVTAGVIAVACAGPALAQTVITQWNFNNNSLGVPTMLVPSVGAGSAVAQGGVTFNDQSGSSDNQSSDPATTNDRAINVTAFPLQSIGSKTAGIAFATSTSGFNNIIVGWDNRFSTTASRWTRFQYTLDITQSSPVWIDGPIFEASLSPFWYNQNSATVSDRRVVDLSSVAGVSNNSRFGFRVVTEFSPVGFTSTRTNGGTYGPNQAYNEVGGSTFAYGTGSTIRFDYVTISGTSNGQSVAPVANVSLSAPALCAGSQVTITADAFPGRNPDSTVTGVTANLTSLGGGAAVAMTRPDPTGFPNRFALTYTIPANSTPGINLSVPVTVTDSQGRTGPGSAQLTVTDCSNVGNVVVSQIYGGGNNEGAPIIDDYVELYNRGSVPANITGWSIQYSPSGPVANFSDTTRLILNGTIPPGRYFLIRMIGGQPPNQPNAVNIPTPDAFLSTEAGATAGIFAVRALPTSLGTACTNVTISDLVHYGGDGCAENGVGAPRTNNRVASFRKGEGCVDTNNNAADFFNAPPSPRNSASPTNTCPNNPIAVTAAFDVATQCTGGEVTLTVTTDAVPGSTVLADLSDFSLSSAVPMALQPDGSYKLVVTLPVTTPGFRQANVYVVNAQGKRGGASARVELLGCNNYVSGFTEPRQVCRDRCSDFRIVAFVTRATQPAPGTITVLADLTAVGGSASTPMFDDGTNGDLVAGDDIYTLTAVAPVSLPLPGVSIPVRVQDDLNRDFVNHVALNTTECSDGPASVRISGFWGGAGLSGATYRSDYVELYNSTDAPVNVTGWSVQVGFDTSAVTLVAPLTGTIQAHGYFLVELLRADAGADLPLPADVVYSTDPNLGINPNASGGKLALVNDSDPIGINYADSNIVDFVGYGRSADFSANFYFEGNGPTVAPSATLALRRVLNGCQDTNNNAADFGTISADVAPRNSSVVEPCGAAPVCQPLCVADYNRDGFLNLDDLGDFITDFYSNPPAPGGLQPNAIQYSDRSVGYGYPCPLAPDAGPPFPVDAFRRTGYRAGYSSDGNNSCPFDPGQPFPNLDNLNDYITFYYGAIGSASCPQ